MSLSPSQMRQKAAAMQESQRHARYAQADGSMRQENTEPVNSAAIHASVARVNAATDKETASIGPQDKSPNASIRF